MKTLKMIAPLFIIAALIIGCDLDDSVSNEGDNGASEFKLVINEYLASNDACCTDENGEFDDWFELYNFGEDSIDIGGMYVTDNKNDYKKTRSPQPTRPRP